MFKDSIFFAKPGEKGLTETSAGHLCALANQICSSSEEFLNNIHFINTKVNIVGNPENSGLSTEVGITENDFNLINEHIDKIAAMNAFIAWFAEARKVLETRKRELRNCGIADWAEKNGKTIPMSPVRPEMVRTSTLEDVIDSLNIKERQEYLELEARASVYGKFLHPGQAMDVARKQLNRIMSQPHDVVGAGRDTTVFTHSPSVNPVVVDNKYVELQNKYRQLEQSLNHKKAELRKKLEALNVEENNQNSVILNNYNEEYQKYTTEFSLLQNEFNCWKLEETAKNASIKLAIPESLIPTMEYLNSLK